MSQQLRPLDVIFLNPESVYSERNVDELIRTYALNEIPLTSIQLVSKVTHGGVERFSLFLSKEKGMP